MGLCPRGCFITDEKVAVTQRGGTDPRGCLIIDEKVAVTQRGGTDPRGCFIIDEKVAVTQRGQRPRGCFIAVSGIAARVVRAKYSIEYCFNKYLFDSEMAVLSRESRAADNIALSTKKRPSNEGLLNKCVR